MNQRKKITILIIVIILLIIFIPLSIFSIGIYKYQWRDKYTRAIAKIIPFPAAVVDYKLIKYSDWLDNIDDLSHFYDKQKELELNLVEIPPKRELESTELERLINLAILEKLAKEYNIKVTTADVDQEFQATIIPQATGGEAEIEQTLKELYNWEISDFKKKVLYEVVLRKKINKHLGQQQIQEEKKAQAQAILDKINAGEVSFEEAAKQYSEDETTAERGGDLGYFTRGIMVKNFEEAAFAMEPGEISQLVRTKFGYHILKCEDKQVEDDIERVNIKHILIKLTTVDDILTEKKATTKIHRFFK